MCACVRMYVRMHALHACLLAWNVSTFVCTRACMSVRLYVCICTYICMHSCMHVRMFICLSTWPVCLSVRPSICWSLRLSVFLPFAVALWVRPSVRLSPVCRVSLPAPLISLRLSLFLSASLRLSPLFRSRSFLSAGSRSLSLSLSPFLPLCL